MKFFSALCLAFLAAAPAYSQISHPNPLLSRGPWPDGLLLRGPGAQIGASFRDLTPAEARQAAAEQNSLFFDRLGVVVYQVRADSPASRAGLVKGDRIRRVRWSPRP